MLGLASALRRARSGFASMPETVVSARRRDALLRRRRDSRVPSAMTGIWTLSSNAPDAPAQATVASLPTTRAQTMRTASGITGFTLPGMIDDPGWRSGMRISPRPVLGPEPIHLRSLQILVRLTAMVRSAPPSSTSASRADCASKWLRASERGNPVSWARSAMTREENPGGVLIPVPTAVPPSGTSATRGSADSRRSIPSRTAAA